MTASGLPENLRYFIARYIVSVEKLEILILLSDRPDISWTVEAVFKVIQSSLSSVTRVLKELSSEGFLKTDLHSKAYQYEPKTASLALDADLLKTMYREKPTRVIEAIFSQSTDQLRKFADAFRFRKDS